MPITFSDGANRVIRSITFSDGTNRTIKAAYFGDGGTNRLVFSSAVNLLGLDPSRIVVSPSTATATYQLTNAGVESATLAGTNTWLPAGSAANYDCRLTMTTGSVTGSATGTWLNLGTTRSWSLTQSVIGSASASGTIEIRDASTLTVLGTATVSFYAEVTT